MQLSLSISRLKRLTLYLFYFLLTASFVFSSENDSEATSPPQNRQRQQPDSSVTGKLNQFNGFYTPRPLPSNANFVYASIWASWSAWSFCANNVQIRVRACNTVRGFTCPGPNQERKPCGAAAQNHGNMRQRLRPNGFGGDYDAVDPWEEDRREALKQLYADYTPPDEPQRPPAPPLRELGKTLKSKNGGNEFIAVQRSPGRTAVVNNGGGGGGYGHVPLAPLRPPPGSDFNRKLHSDGTGQAPSMTPELLFGSKLEIPPRRIKSSSSESKEQKLEGIGSAERKDNNNNSASASASSSTSIETSASSKSSSREQEKQQTITKVEKEEEKIGVGRPVPSTETNENPLKVGMHQTNNKNGGFENEKIGEISKNESVNQGIDGSQTEGVDGQSQGGEVFGESSVTDILPPIKSTIESTTQNPKTIESELEDSSIAAATVASANIETSNIHTEASSAAIENLEGSETAAEEVVPRPRENNNIPPKSQSFQINGGSNSAAAAPQAKHLSLEDDDSDLMNNPQNNNNHDNEFSGSSKIHISQTNMNNNNNNKKIILDNINDDPSNLPKDEMYDDQFEAAENLEKTTQTPEDKIKQLEADMDALETQISEKLHSGEVKFNKDTEKALEWMLANMTKAAEEAAARQSKLEETKNVIKVKHHHAAPLHSGEVEFPLEQEHSGEIKNNGLFGKTQVLDAKQFGSKISPLDSPITLRKIQPESSKQHYDSLKYQHDKIIKPIELKITKHEDKKNTEAELLESDLRKLRIEMANMQSELIALQGDTSSSSSSIVEVEKNVRRTTIAPNLKALDLELVPKGPRLIPSKNGPNVPIISSNGNNDGGQVFLLDAPNNEKSEAKWSSWREWGDCFCDKQVRTRICNYESGFHSKGCQGKSFESRPCITSRPCPAKIAAKKLLTTTTMNPLKIATDSNGLYTLSPRKGPRNGYAFKPNPLSVAISS